MITLSAPTNEQHIGLVAHLRSLGFKPAPGPRDRNGSGAVHLATADGIYFNLASDNAKHPWDIQLLVVGAMPVPIELAEKVSDDIIPLAPANYWVKDVRFLDADPSMLPGARQIITDRGFFS